ncbi:hypothetical protein BLNAU_6753 [Blattamonas nauphoetae]|uniref:Serine-threonine/tyrosine-protein kinase catalytic domain-containing protein n=1 Tax=Blattamonas nauphoetae TaxID=2049346 RepID=A0ABQ9Y3F5_9EUKA|nr:hypothetical protein BLNAU_6753 [Blattamonas nauphoetae]
MRSVVNSEGPTTLSFATITLSNLRIDGLLSNELIEATGRVQHSQLSNSIVDKIVIEQTTITHKRGSEEAESDIDELCGFEGNGLLSLTNVSATITSSSLSLFTEGALRVTSSDVTLIGVSFWNPSGSLLFPSAQRNILCSNSVLDYSLPNSDTATQTGLSWVFVKDECELIGINQKAPLFTPTVSDKSKASKVANKKEIDFTIQGEMLMPCGLSIRIFDPSKVSNDELKTIPVSQLRPTEWNETNLVVKVEESELTGLSLSKGLSWTLEFGNAQFTQEHVVSLSNMALSPSTKKLLSWMIPVIVVLVLVVVFLIVLAVLITRRKNRKAAENQQEEMDDVDEKMEVEDGYAQSSVNVPGSTDEMTSNLESEERPNRGDKDDEPEDSHAQPAEEVLICGNSFDQTYIFQRETLYSRLHTKAVLFNRLQAMREIARGLLQVSIDNPDSELMKKFTPHMVLFDNQNRVCLKLNVPKQQPAQSLTTQERPNDEFNDQPVLAADPSEPTPAKAVGNEGIRWEAPECSSKSALIDPRKAAVFSLGLVMWEIETGLVPFGEMDAVNAQRQLSLGVGLKMDGVKPEFREMIEKCVHPDPTERPTLKDVTKFAVEWSLKREAQNPAPQNPNQ